NQIAARFPEHELVVKGRGLARGLQMPSGDIAGQIAKRSFEEGLLVETSGPSDEVVKLLPALTIPDEQLKQCLDIIEAAVAEALSAAPPLPVGPSPLAAGRRPACRHPPAAAP